VTWFSKRQPTLALSSTEAEYQALSEVAREAVWLKAMMRDMGVDSEEPLMLRCDNESSIKLARNPIFHSKTKHIIVHYHFAREQLESGEINVTYIPTTEQLADFFTKPLNKPLFDKFRTALHIVSTTEALERNLKD
jgi:hypothetical protein